MAAKDGYWVMLSNIHLMVGWLKELLKIIDNLANTMIHNNFRLFLSSDASNGIPISLLDRSIKLTNEPPIGIKENTKKAWNNLKVDGFDNKDPKEKNIMFGLAYFHAMTIERKKFGPIGWNMMYPFSDGDLKDCAKVLAKYIDNLTSAKVPWDDLKYIFGEVMYGGHIVDNWDRRTCMTYFNWIMKDQLLDETELCPYTNGKLSHLRVLLQDHMKYIINRLKE